MTVYAQTDSGGFFTAIAEGAVAPEGTWVALPADSWPGWGARPSPKHRPALVDGAVVWSDPRTLAQARLDRIAAMRAAREAAIASPFTWDGSSFDADQVSQTRLLGLFIASQAPAWPGQLWRLANNDWRLLDASDMADVWAALQAHLAEHFTTFATREAAINAAATLAAVDAITWET